MTQIYTELPKRISEMAEGDEEFRSELTQAIFNGLLELKEKYAEGLKDQDMVMIQQIRHKVKPTLLMFDLEPLTISLQEGKEILETEGFSSKFQDHFHDFFNKVEQAIAEVGTLVKVN
ncbi:hypothetical protein [Algoriphagus mannitolivorans]|uniref:hypothetical protein n=1 Tax=Algoriphagus mannitolivorans TaxID=226504 RepID=UPI0004014648|nr:hypothetical protein [Algoriphagus mannitolivorans]